MTAVSQRTGPVAFRGKIDTDVITAPMSLPGVDQRMETRPASPGPA